MVAPVACTAAQLTAYDSGATSHGNRFVTKIVLTNGSTKACTISGYPKLAFLLSGGVNEGVTVRFTTHDANFTTAAPTTISLAPSQAASFLLGYPKADAQGNSCDAISTIAILGFPNGGAVRLPDTLSPCSTVNVSPYFHKQ